MSSAKYIRPLSTRSELKRVRALQQKKYREEERRYLVQGRKVVEELLASGQRIERIYATAAAAATIDHPAVEVLPGHEMDRIGTLESGNELVAVVHMPEPLQPLEIKGHGLILALDGINDPGNLGTVLRIADWFGIDNVYCTPGSVDSFNPKCVQASMGAIFRVDVHYQELTGELVRLRDLGATLYMATMEGDPVFEVELARPAVLVLGSESHGISAPVRMLGCTPIAIPGSGRSESLNVATAAAALCMEFARQWRMA